MTVNVRNLDWLRSLKLDGHPEFGARLHELVTDLKNSVSTIEQQTNSNAAGTPTAPTQPDALHIVPHPAGVQFAITHKSDFYKGISYRIDAMAGGVTHTYDVGASRNGILPVGNLKANYQVRATYPSGASTAAVRYPKTVTGGSGTAALLPSQGAGTTRAGQPPGFGGPYRGNTPPVRSS
jgi:hypothetical protein